MLKKILVVAFCWLSFGCRYNTAPNTKLHPSPSTEFDTFFAKFRTNADMQISHIQFPLKVLYLGEDGDMNKPDSVRILQKKDWHFSGERVKGLIIKKDYKKHGEVDVTFQIEDTGINIVHVFKRDGKMWRLTQIVDSSD